jgi:hypothetical protein
LPGDALADVEFASLCGGGQAGGDPGARLDVDGHRLDLSSHVRIDAAA